MPNEGDLKIWWIPQVPMKSFQVPVKDIEEAQKLLDVLAGYDYFQFNNNVKPDYANAGGLLVYENGEWLEWYNDDGEDITMLSRNREGGSPQWLTEIFKS